MDIIKKRKLEVEGMVCGGCEEKVIEALKEMKGVSTVSADHNENKVNLEYNLLNVTLKEIEHKILELGYKLPESFLKKKKRNFVHFTEENERDNYLAKNCGCNVTSSCYPSSCYLNSQIKSK